MTATITAAVRVTPLSVTGDLTGDAPVAVEVLTDQHPTHPAVISVTTARNTMSTAHELLTALETALQSQGWALNEQTSITFTEPLPKWVEGATTDWKQWLHPSQAIDPEAEAPETGAPPAE